MMAINQTQLIDLLTEHRRRNWRGIQTSDWQQKIVISLAEEQEPRVLRRIEPHFQLSPNATILDLGSGIGNFVVACRKRGLRAFGIEPDRIGQSSSATALGIAAQRLDEAAFAAAVGEQLPFADSTFDLIVMDQVIEHVQAQCEVLAEAWRSLKPGGAMYIACPNYLRFYEPHYKIRFFPLMPKFLGSLYLRVRGRDPVLLKQITYTTNWRVRKLLAQAGICTIRDLNREDLLARCTGHGSSRASWKGRLLRRLAAVPGISEQVLRAAALYLRLREGGSELLAFKEA